MDKRTYDAIVIGAGVIGASIAFHLGRLGAGRTLVLDRGGVCSGNTRKSGALIRVHYSNAPEARLALASLPYFHHWADLVGGDAGFRNVGFVLLVGAHNAERLERNLAMLQALGARTWPLDAVALRELVPGIVLDDGALAVYEPDGGYADPVATTEALLQAARARGAEVREGVTVTAIRRRGGRVVGVASTDGDLDAPLVFCAANIWSPALLRDAGVSLDLWAQRSQLGFYRRPPEVSARGPVLLDLARGSYGRPQGADLYLIGGAWMGEERVDPDAFPEEPDPAFAARAREEFGVRLPPLRAATYVRGQAGVYDMSPDTRAVLDRAPEVEGLYIAAGFSGTGFKIAPIVGAGLAELALTGRARAADLHPFRLSRFAEGQPIRSDTEYALGTDWGIRF